MPTKHVLAAIWLWLAPAVVASGWNANGHAVIDLVAYAQLSENAKAAAVALLKDHPRYDQHFLGRMPQNVWNGSEAEKDQWVFSFAGCWPDLVRNQSDVVTREDVTRYNRPVWHYVNLPVFLSAADEAAMLDSLAGNRELEPPDARDEPSMNVVQAIKNAQRVLADDQASRQEQAVSLCWQLHLVADLHQPCHSSSLYTPQRFPQGDRGANDINARGGLKLHAYWDRAILDGADYNRVRRKALDLPEDVDRDKLQRQLDDSPDVDQWLAFSNKTAARYVYDTHLRKLVADAETRDKLGPMNPPASYERDAARVAKGMAWLASKRIAGKLSEVLGAAGE